MLNLGHEANSSDPYCRVSGSCELRGQFEVRHGVLAKVRKQIYLRRSNQDYPLLRQRKLQCDPVTTRWLVQVPAPRDRVIPSL